MGQTFKAKCNCCGREFEFDEGGGFCFYLLRCNRCGRVKEISFDEVDKFKLKYPRNDDRYYDEVEELVGQCRCGGDYLFCAPARCPECKSTNIDIDDDPVMFYD